MQIPDGTAAVSAEDVYETKVSHWETEKAVHAPVTRKSEELLEKVRAALRIRVSVLSA